MVVGDCSIFAIESTIKQAFEERGLKALGSFVIHVGGKRYGVEKTDATLLACSYDEVAIRLGARGLHSAPFSNEPDGGKIGDAFREAVYGERQRGSYFGLPLADFRALFYKQSSGLLWTPDGDQAFDDGSYVLQFDIQDLVRLVAFRSKNGYRHDPESLSDVRLPASEYYEILQRWLDLFEKEWLSLPKSVL